jgi:hypothetical protein
MGAREKWREPRVRIAPLAPGWRYGGQEEP